MTVRKDNVREKHETDITDFLDHNALCRIMAQWKEKNVA